MKKFNLELTSLNHCSDDSETLMLGEWCNPKKKKSVTVNYHWDDRKKLYEDFQYINSLYEKYLKYLTDSLNRIHQKDYSSEYWRIIIGPWLHYFISIFVDRYMMLRLASEDFEIRQTRIPVYDHTDWIPLDYVDFNYKFYTDQWNYYLYSEILRLSPLIPVRQTDFPLRGYKAKDKKQSLIKSILFFLTKFTRIIPRHVTFIEIDMPQKYLYKLLLKLSSFSFSYYLRVQPKYFKPDWDLRESIMEDMESGDDLERVLSEMIPSNMPIAYLEGYGNIEKDAENIFPRKTKIMITSNAYFSNEHFKVWASKQKLNGAKLWVMVHGGHHGTALFNGPGKLTEDIADRFYSWGWGDFNLPSPKLSVLKQRKLNQESNHILFIPYNISKYSNHLDSSPIASSFNDCIEMHRNFFKLLDRHNLIEHLYVRLKSGFTLWDLKSEYEKENINNFILSNDETIIESISKSGLVVVTYDSTVFLESLSLNSPTCLFIRKEYWEMSEQSSMHFKALHECGILHYDEYSLMDHISNLNSDYISWWNSSKVQRTIKSFLSEYGMSSLNWEHKWHEEIKIALKEYEDLT